MKARRRKHQPQLQAVSPPPGEFWMGRHDLVYAECVGLKSRMMRARKLLNECIDVLDGVDPKRRTKE